MDAEISLGWDLNRGTPNFQPNSANLFAIKSSYSAYSTLTKFVCRINDGDQKRCAELTLGLRTLGICSLFSLGVSQSIRQLK